MFELCSSLTKVDFPNLTAIHSFGECFEGVTQQVEINIPNETSINGKEFSSPSYNTFHFFGTTVEFVSNHPNPAPAPQGQQTPRYLLPNPICFPAEAPVTTDQGDVYIENIIPGKHTVRGNEIEGVSKTVEIESHLVCIRKGSVFPNVPSRDTLVSPNHSFYLRGNMVMARDMVHIFDGVENVVYNGEPLYNVLLRDKHDVMLVNNLIAETLHPNNLVAVYIRLKNQNLTPEQLEKVERDYIRVTKELWNI